MGEHRKFEAALESLNDIGEFPDGPCSEYIAAVNAVENWEDLFQLTDEFCSGYEEEDDALLKKLRYLFETFPDDAQKHGDTLYTIKLLAVKDELRNYVQQKLNEMDLPDGGLDEDEIIIINLPDSL